MTENTTMKTPSDQTICRLYQSARALVASLSVVAFVAAIASAEVVSWNVDNNGTIGGDGAGSLPSLGALAGIEQVGGWTNDFPAFDYTNLRDSLGNPTTLDIAPFSNAGTWNINGFSHAGQDTNGTWNNELLSGYLNSGAANGAGGAGVVLSQIPYDNYNIIAYFNSDDATRTGTVSNGASTYSFKAAGAAGSLGGDGNATFFPANALTTTSDTANYAVFSNLTGTSQTITVDIPDFGGLAGFQLVNLGSSSPNTINFSPLAPGVEKSVPTWGVDAAWPNFDNVRQSIEHIGQPNVDAVRVLVYFDEPLVSARGTFELNAAAKMKIDEHLARAAEVGKTNIPLTFGTGGTYPGQIDATYLQGGGVNALQYARAIKATQEYINSQPGFTASPIMAIEAFNEPDFLLTYASPAGLNSIIAQLKTYSEFQNTLMVAPSTLNSDFAQGWYDQVPEATAGSSHLLAGSLTSWTDFIDHVNDSGKPFVSMELHSMGEILAGADRDMQIGMVWADVLRGRGTLIQASDGERLGYTEDFGNQSAAAVYRAPDGQLYAFAGALERDYTSTHSAFRFESDQPVYFNGIPVREYYLHAKPDEFVDATDNDFQHYGSASSEGSFATIDLDDSGIPALDGYRWKIVSVQDGSVMEVFGSGTGDGAQIRSAADDGDLNQLWRITQTRNGYIHLYNANSGRTAEIAGFSLGNGTDVRQWGTADNQLQQWYVEQAGDGSFHIRNAFSNKYLDADLGSANIFQWEGTGGSNQKWQFVLANPTHGPLARYTMQGDSLDSAGANHGTVIGSPTYEAGPTGAPNSAIEFDGVDDYVQLPGTVANSEDITVATWVKWEGGDAWQRIFDFGNDTNQYMFLTPSSSEGRMHFGITTSSDAGEYILETAELPTDEWVHLTLTLGGNTGILYINGVPQVAGQILPDPTDFNPTNNYIGASQWAQDPLFNGSIADFQIFDYALHPTQVAELIQMDNGDFNGDGIVNAADYTIWRDSLGATGLSPYDLGDANGDGAVTSEDYGIWRSQFGQSIPTALSLARSYAIAQAVPEPRAIWGVAIVIVCFAIRFDNSIRLQRRFD